MTNNELNLMDSLFNLDKTSTNQSSVNVSLDSKYQQISMTVQEFVRVHDVAVLC